jgi:hypothetical protein
MRNEINNLEACGEGSILVTTSVPKRATTLGQAASKNKIIRGARAHMVDLVKGIPEAHPLVASNMHDGMVCLHTIFNRAGLITGTPN